MSVLNQTYNPPSSCFGFCTAAEETSPTGNNPTFNHQQGPISTSSADPRSLATSAEDREKQQELDDLLSKGMSGLSFQERQQQQEILHGVADFAAEDQTILDRALHDLDFHLKSTKEGSVYEVAERMNPEYVNARAFRVMFLRANDYDPKASADQMLRFFNLKNELFGTEKLTKDITVDDLDEDAIHCLKSGGIQILGKDRSGRYVIIFVGGVYAESKNVQSDMRVQFFIAMEASQQTEEVQLRGSVSIWYAIGDYKTKSNGGRYFENYIVSRALPQKKAAIHICVDDVQQFFLGNAMIKVMKESLRARLRLHFGSQMECQYHLSTYGIPSDLLPVHANGKLNLDRHLHWVRSCPVGTRMAVRPKSLKLPEEANNYNSTTTSPKDVLFTGGRVNYNEGNKRFLSLVQDYAQVYDSGITAKSKRQVVDEIIDKIHQSGGRFLRRPASSCIEWEEVPLEVLRKKVTQSFRNLRVRRRKNLQNKTIESK